MCTKPSISVVKNQPADAGDAGWIPGPGKIPWRRKWQPTPVFLPRESCGQRSLGVYSRWGCQEWDTTEHAHPKDGRLYPAVNSSTMAEDGRADHLLRCTARGSG